jgi:signal transduction histidine kinase
MTPSMRIAHDYAAALSSYLDGGGEAALHTAYETGRRALEQGLDLLELVSLHHDVLRRSLATGDGPAERALAAAQTFLAESLSPFEMAHQQFRDAVAALRGLNVTLEAEVQRIAHALHDDAGQLLVSVHLAIDEVGTDLPVAARERLRSVRALLDEVELHLRRLSHELRPMILDDLGLVPAIQFLAHGVSARTGVAIDVDGAEEPRLPQMVEIALYRIVQEALTNATRHARPSKVTVLLQTTAACVVCSVCDDGIGFDAGSVMARNGQPGLGLLGLRARLQAVGGHMTLESAPGRGTELCVFIPLEVGDDDRRSTG